MSGEVLEIGCGNFRDARATVAIDMLAGTQADYVMDAQHLLFPDASFNKVLMFECLEHTDSPMQVLKEIHRVLSDGGELEMSVPNVYWYRLFARWTVKGKVDAVLQEHIWNWSEVELRNLLNRVGFVVEREWFGDYERHHGKSTPILSWLLPRIGRHSIFIVARKK